MIHDFRSLVGFEQKPWREDHNSWASRVRPGLDTLQTCKEGPCSLVGVKLVFLVPGHACNRPGYAGERGSRRVLLNWPASGLVMHDSWRGHTVTCVSRCIGEAVQCMAREKVLGRELALGGQTVTRARLAGEVEGRTAAGRRAKGWVRDRLDAKAMHGPCWWERAGQ